MNESGYARGRGSGREKESFNPSRVISQISSFSIVLQRAARGPQTLVWGIRAVAARGRYGTAKSI